MIENKYARCYFRLIERARGRTRADGMERHHVLPKSLGGTNEAANLVYLTFREHFLAHWLLTKFTDGEQRRSMRRALACMKCSRQGRALTGWQFALARRALSLSMKGKRYALGVVRSPETRAKMGLAKRRENLSIETREKLSAAARNRTPVTREKLRQAATNLSDETRARRSESASQRRHDGHTRAKISAAMQGHKRCVGRVLSEETKAKIGAASRARWQAIRESGA